MEVDREGTRCVSWFALEVSTYGVTHQSAQRTGFAKDRDLRWVSAECSDVVLHPLQRVLLILLFVNELKAALQKYDFIMTTIMIILLWLWSWLRLYEYDYHAFIMIMIIVNVFTIMTIIIDSHYVH